MYNSQGWNFKTTFDIDPKLEKFNNSVPICNQREAIIVRYAKMIVELVRKPIYVQRNWIPFRWFFRNEFIHSAYDVSLKVDKSMYLGFS